MTTRQYSVRVLPTSGNGPAYDEVVQAVNPPMARKLVEARIPAGWQMCTPRITG